MSDLIQALFEPDMLLALLVALHVLYHRRPTQTLIIWLLLVMLMPWVGALLYLLFASRKVFARRTKPLLDFPPATVCHPSHPLQQQVHKLCISNGLPPALGDNRLELTIEPATARSWLLQAIEQARHSIHLETYIFRLDATGRELLGLLAEKARQGVQVRLLIDAFGSLRAYLSRGAFGELIEAGGEVVFFQPLGSLFKSRINLRNHRKIYLFDQQKIIAGGINLGAEYLDPGIAQTWADMTFRLEGTVVPMYAQIFAADWHYATGSVLDMDSAPLPLGHQVVQVIPSGPDLEQDTLREALLCAIHQARSEIHMMTPYFIPDQLVLEAVMMAVKRGVRVRLLTPVKTDHLLFDWGRAPYMRELAEAGVEIRCFSQGMLHAKAVVFDHALAMMGSANLDYRSLLINYEVVTLCYDERTIGNLLGLFDALDAKAAKFEPVDTGWRRFCENLVRIITPAL